MKKAQKLKKFKGRMQRKPTKSEKIFVDYFKQVYTKEEFKNQCILGLFILDFVIVPKLLVIEIDGSSHDNKFEYDKRRDDFITQCHFNILHVTNHEIENHFGDVLQKIELYPIQKDYEKKFRHSLGRANAFKSVIVKKIKRGQMRIDF